jgi:hypothetical protein
MPPLGGLRLGRLPVLAGMGSDQEVVDRVLTEEGEETEPSFFASPKRILQTVVVVVLLLAAIYILLPRIVGIQGAVEQLGNAAPGWLVVALVFCVLMFFSYVALFRGVVGESVVHLEWSESYQITMAGLAATRLFSAGGAGGIVLTYWALRKAGMERRQTACRMVAFLVLLYAVYMVALVVFGVLLRVGVLSGESPAGLTIVPAAIAGGILVIGLAIALIPNDVERRLARFAQGYRFHRIAQRLASAPATLASGTRTAIAFVRNPSRGGLGVVSRLRRAHPAGDGRAGLLHRDGGEPVPAGARRRRGGRRGDDRDVRALRPAELRGVRRRAHLSAGGVLAADPARDRRVLPAPPDRIPLGGGAGQGAGERGHRRPPPRDGHYFRK